jgi:DNA-binding LytR/AlgR family response regulator
MNILVCEDNQFQAQTLIDHLQTLEYVTRVDIVTTGEEMISVALERSDITAIFLDVDLPGMNGLEAYGILRMKGRNIPTVLITGVKPSASDTYHLDIIDVIEKPYLPPRLEEALKKLQLHIQYQNFIKSGGILVPVISDRILQLTPDDILFIESVSGGVKVHTTTESIDGKYIPLKIYEEYLRRCNFVFSHRAFLVNTQKIDKKRTESVGNNYIYFKGESERKALVAEDRFSAVRSLLQRIDMLLT